MGLGGGVTAINGRHLQNPGRLDRGFGGGQSGFQALDHTDAILNVSGLYQNRTSGVAGQTGYIARLPGFHYRCHPLFLSFIPGNDNSGISNTIR